MKRIYSTAPGNTQRGSNLIEVLVTLVVVSVGLLSAVSLQLLSKRSNFDAAQRTIAANLAQDLIARMRTNPNGLIGYVPGGTLGGDVLGAAPAIDCLAAAANCTPAQLANFDRWHWEQQLDGAFETTAGTATGGLTAPTACITGPVFGGAGNYTIAIAWRGLTESSNPATNACGQGTGNYGTGDRYRRVMVVQTFLSAI
jgi:type IV pilus assembly protein PilV